MLHSTALLVEDMLIEKKAANGAVILTRPERLSAVLIFFSRSTRDSEALMVSPGGGGVELRDVLAPRCRSLVIHRSETSAHPIPSEPVGAPHVLGGKQEAAKVQFKPWKSPEILQISAAAYFGKALG